MSFREGLLTGNLVNSASPSGIMHDAYLEDHKKEGTLIMSEDLEVFLAQLLGNTGRNGAMVLIDRRRLYETRCRDGL